MISLVCVGISECADKSIQKIECARKDAETVYSTFKRVLGNSFSEFSSITLINPRADNFISLLSGMATVLTKEDITIVYLSCHGLEDNGELNLVFSDEDGNGHGMLGVNRLRSVLNRNKGEYLLIFDCCYSETALVLANKPTASNRNNISVVASTEYYMRAKFGEDGSYFTKALCDAIMQVFDEEKDLSLNNIIATIHKNGVPCYVNLSEGKSDLLLKCSPENYNDFSRVFLSRVRTHNRYVREMLWYSIDDLPAKESLGVVDDFIASSVKVCEADWLVRRAIGSMLSSIKGNTKRVYDTALRLMNSSNWMLQTIGLIATRKGVTKEIAQLQREMVTDRDNPMSLVWLADLYFSDSVFSDIVVSLASNLGKTGWGLIQIWDRYSKRYNNMDELYEIIRNRSHDETVLAELNTELYLRGIDAGQVPDLDCAERMKNSKLIHILYHSEPRGRTAATTKKWLFSMLYGNWRGQLSVDLDEYFSNTKATRVAEDLLLVKSIPSPEKRAAIFSYFQNAEMNFNYYKKYLLWGVTDPHPWVRREAVIAFKDDIDVIERAFDDVIDRQLYIGTFDLILNASRFLEKSFLRKYIERYPLTPCEHDSLIHALENE